MKLAFLIYFVIIHLGPTQAQDSSEKKMNQSEVRYSMLHANIAPTNEDLEAKRIALFNKRVQEHFNTNTTGKIQSYQSLDQEKRMMAFLMREAICIRLIIQQILNTYNVL